MSPAAAATEWFRRAPLRLLLLAASSNLAHALLPILTRQRLNQTFGSAVLSQVNLCVAQLSGTPCAIGALMEDVATTTFTARARFDECHSGCDFPQAFCDDFWNVMLTRMPQWQEICTSQLSDPDQEQGTRAFPEDCTVMVEMISTELQSPRFDVPVKCGIVSPGDSQERMPHCSSLAKVIVSYQRPLTGSDCGSLPHTRCRRHFCDLYTQLRWWMRPRQLQEATYAFRYPLGFVLPGCEVVDAEPFNEQECPDRVDINGLCDCFCHNMHLMPRGPELAQCSLNVEDYMLFGRVGVVGVELSTDCEDSLCGLFHSVREGPACSFMRLPNRRDCRALQLPEVGSDTCQWLEHSGEEGVLECLDGHRCNIEDESWACCAPGLRGGHIGRGKCPADLPVMCDHICGGETDFCCMVHRGECTPRDCTPFILKTPPSMFHFTSSTTTTTEFVDNSEEPGLFDFDIRIGAGSWVWLLLLIPVFFGLVILAIWYYGRLARWYAPEGSDMLDENSDKYGIFRIVRNPRNAVDQPIKGQLVIIMVEDLPNLRPLGLELLETKVMRVHPRGARFGWHVGDVIREVAGHEVHTFEEIWQRIQIERDRCPVKFVAERFDWSVDAARATTPPEMQAIKALKRGGGSNAKIGPLPAPADLTGTLENTGVPTSAIVGWETWAVAKGPEETANQSPQNAEDELQKGLKAAETTREKEVAARKLLAARRREGADEARKAWEEDRKSPPHERDLQATGSELNNTQITQVPTEDLNNTQLTMDLRATATATTARRLSDTVGGQLKEIAATDRPLTLVEEKAVADRVARTYHRQRNTPHAKAPKEEVRWIKDGWGRQVRTYV